MKERAYTSLGGHGQCRTVMPRNQRIPLAEISVT
jgi:hypothetical protein